MFWAFGALSFLALSLLCTAVFFAINHIVCSTSSEPITFSSFFPYYSPIPIAGLLLWVFIVQMNRSQRQLIVFSQHLHNLSYTEGLLKSINSFAPSIEDAVKRINDTIDKMLEDHLRIHPALLFREEYLANSDKNQTAGIEEMIALLKEIKGLIK